jgi:hypothetical protein
MGPLRTLRLSGAVAGGLLLAAAIICVLDRPAPPSPPIATLPLQREPEPRPPETMTVYRGIADGVHEQDRVFARSLLPLAKVRPRRRVDARLRTIFTLLGRRGGPRRPFPS